MSVNLEALVCERLRLCAEDMGLKRAWDTPPSSRIERDDMPCAYTLIGPTFAAQTQVSARGLIVIPRNYVFRVILWPMQAGTDDQAGGAEGTRLALEWTTKVHLYFASHPRLSTSTLEDLRWCQGIVGSAGQSPILSDTGFVERRVPGGETAGAIDFTLPIVMSGSVAALRG